MPKLWNETIEAHRRDVRDAILETTAALVASEGLLSVTMSRIAEETGIGRATLYKYYGDVESILLDWHGRQIAAHLKHLVAVRDAADGPLEQLRAVLGAYATLQHESRDHADSELASVLHRDHQVHAARHRVRQLVQEAIAACADENLVRSDIGPAELADFCLGALAASAHARSNAAVQRLVQVTLDGLHVAT